MLPFLQEVQKCTNIAWRSSIAEQLYAKSLLKVLTR